MRGQRVALVVVVLYLALNWRKTSHGRVGPATGSKLTFDTNHLLECVENFNQIALVVHHLIDVLVRLGNLIDHIGVFSALDSSRLWSEILNVV
jgi:hypothetical protein